MLLAAAKRVAISGGPGTAAGFALLALVQAIGAARLHAGQQGVKALHLLGGFLGPGLGLDLGDAASDLAG